MKKLFQSTAFRCITVLLLIVLLCSVFLTICNALLFVTPEERLDRAIAKIYHGEAVETKIADGAQSLADSPLEVGRATILEVRIVTSENHKDEYLVKSCGKDGYQNGTVTCWIVIRMSAEGSIQGIGNVVVDSNTNQSYISKVKPDYLSRFGELYDGSEYSPDEGFLASGASYSSNAICNAVNGALNYVSEYLTTDGGTQP